jgi:hypothetical protein
MKTYSVLNCTYPAVGPKKLKTKNFDSYNTEMSEFYLNIDRRNGVNIHRALIENKKNGLLNKSNDCNVMKDSCPLKLFSIPIFKVSNETKISGKKAQKIWLSLPFHSVTSSNEININSMILFYGNYVSESTTPYKIFNSLKIKII